MAFGFCVASSLGCKQVYCDPRMGDVDGDLARGRPSVEWRVLARAEEPPTRNAISMFTQAAQWPSQPPPVDFEKDEVLRLHVHASSSAQIASIVELDGALIVGVDVGAGGCGGPTSQRIDVAIAHSTRSPRLFVAQSGKHCPEASP